MMKNQSRWLNIISLFRIPHYLKNLFIFLPLFFAGELFQLEKLINTFYGFIVFSFFASGVYIFNDIRDRENDQKHPIKKNRPIASGQISIRFSYLLILFIVLLGSILLIFMPIEISVIMLVYFILNIAYSLGLKQIAVIDVFIIAFGFVLRVIMGSAVANVEISKWIVVMTFLLSLFLALAKRRDDVLLFLRTGHKTRKVIDGYNIAFLNTSITLMAGITLVAYIMYTIDDHILRIFQTDRLYITTIFVLLGIMRYLQLVFVYEKSGSPTRILMKDLMIQLSLAGWFIAFLIIIYLI